MATEQDNTPSAAPEDTEPTDVPVDVIDENHPAINDTDAAGSGDIAEDTSAATFTIVVAFALFVVRHDVTAVVLHPDPAIVVVLLRRIVYDLTLGNFASKHSAFLLEMGERFLSPVDVTTSYNPHVVHPAGKLDKAGPIQHRRREEPHPDVACHYVYSVQT